MGFVGKLSKILKEMELARIIARENGDFVAGVREELMLHDEVRQRSRRCIEPLFARFLQYHLALQKTCGTDLEQIITDPGCRRHTGVAVELFYGMYLKDDRYRSIRNSLICLPREMRHEVENSFQILDAWHDLYGCQHDERKNEIDAKIPTVDLALFILKVIYYLEINLEKAADDLEIRESVVEEILALEYQSTT